ncbi:MAG: DUF177 domain-containing protein [Polyangiaceae bacterium]|nr:DUF177 domain-containing protein [Polyangiaceae bacterium]
MSHHEFTISVTDLDAGGEEFRFIVRSAWIRQALEDDVDSATASDTDGVLALRVSKSGHDVAVHGTLDVNLRVPCARCLNLYDYPLQSDITVLYVPSHRIHDHAPSHSPSKGTGKGPSAAGNHHDHHAHHEPHVEAEYEFSSEEADTLPYDGEQVVLDDLVRDEIILGIPMIPLCSEACPGMSSAPKEPSAPSEKKGIDPRLVPLLKFHAKETKS